MTVTLSLISHTNVGKTTLARTLLRRDVGETRDASHVTVVSEAHEMIRSGEHSLLLWDTPGFGDTARLLRRLKSAEKPVGWFVGQVWDRLADRPLWCSQQAIRNVREDADIVLYLVDASQDPEEAGYVRMEMEILGWIGKPVVVLLNQTGTATDAGAAEGELAVWRDHLGGVAVVQDVAMLDAFSRCWVQEDLLLARLKPHLQLDKRDAYGLLSAAWSRKNRAAFDASIAVMANLLSDSAQAGRSVDPGTFLQKLGVGRQKITKAAEKARGELADELAEGFAQSTNALLSIHELSGQAGKPLLELAAESFGMPERVSEPAWGVVGGAAVGATGGLAADILAGGMTAFGGTLLGAASGGFGAYFLAKGFNLTKGDGNQIRWTAEHFKEQWRRQILGYLAVAHFGRGRGEWRVGAPPEHWEDAVKASVDEASGEIESIWKKAGKADSEELREKISNSLSVIVQEILLALYPSARSAVE